MSDIKYPDVVVGLSGHDGNAFYIIGRTVAVMRKAGVPQDELNAFEEEAKSGDYDHALDTVKKWVTVL